MSWANECRVIDSIVYKTRRSLVVSLRDSARNGIASQMECQLRTDLAVSYPKCTAWIRNVSMFDYPIVHFSTGLVGFW